MATPNMNLTLPVVSATPGPQWASQINNDLALIDAHNHTSGSGAAIPTAALNINADLKYNNNSATLLASTQFTDTNGFTPSFASGLYVKLGDLWFNNGSATAVRLTQNGSIVGAGGTINGLPSGTASVNYLVGSGSYQFQQAINQAAGMDVGPITIRKTSASSNGVTVQPSNTTTSYSLTLPPSVPTAQSALSMSTSGVVTNAIPDTSITITSGQIKVATGGIKTANIDNGQVTLAKLASPTQVRTASSNTISIPSTGIPTLISQTTFIFPTNRPIWIGLQYRQGTGPTATDAAAFYAYQNVRSTIYFEIAGSYADTVGKYEIINTGTGILGIPASCLWAFSYPSVSSGLITITAYGEASGYVAGAGINNVALVAYQI